jgi:hypothetical protein
VSINKLNQGMSGNFQEYVAYLDTHNAEPKLDPDENPTNNVIIPCQFPSRLNVAQISLGSLELPLAQYNIENEWNTLEFDEGIDLFVMAPQFESIVQFVINENGTDVIGQLPPRLNPIVAVAPLPNNINPTSVTFTTQYPHQLELRGFFNWGEPMKVTGTPLFDSAINQLTLTNPNLTILNPYQFSLTLSGAALTFSTNPTNLFGYVTTPSIPSPDYLATLVTFALNLVAPGHWKIAYDSSNGKYKLTWVGTNCEAKEASPATLMIDGVNSLPNIMGFGFVNVPIPIPGFDVVTYKFEKPRELPNLSGNSLQSINCSPSRSRIEIDMGNYSPNELMANVARQFDRFFFDSGCNTGAALLNVPTLFYYSNQCGICYSFAIPFGMYSPDSFATFLQTQIQINISSMSVTWDVNTGQFTFEAASDFGLEFDAATVNTTIQTAELAFRLGFYPISYRNNNTYKSVMPFYYPTKGSCGTSMPDRHLSYVYSPMPQQILNNQKRFAIELTKTRSIATVGPVVNNADHTLSVTTQLFLSGGGGSVVPIAHGFQVLDVVEVTVSGNTYELTVIRVDSYDQFTVELGSIPIGTIANLTAPVSPFTSPAPPYNTYCVRLSNAIVSNIYFTCLENDVLALTLGFNKTDYLWNPAEPTSWIAPALYSLDYPTYVLVEMTQPTGATHNMHPWNTDSEHTDTISNVLAKVIIYPQFRMERNFPFTMIIPDLRIINRVQIRILNPNHSPYKLHGRNFSFTLVMQSVMKSINQLCY